MKIKICGLTRHCDIQYVNQALPDYAGFVFADSRRRIEEETAMELRSHLLDGICPVGVFKNAGQGQVLRLAAKGIIDVIQLHGDETPEYIAHIKERIPAPVIKAISVGNKKQEADMKAYKEAGIDFFLFDQGAGGSGCTFDWERMPVTDVPFFLAGGLYAGNVREAMERLSPYAVDISSGVETDGFKDGMKIKEIVEMVKRSAKYVNI